MQKKAKPKKKRCEAVTIEHCGYCFGCAYNYGLREMEKWYKSKKGVLNGRIRESRTPA